MLLGLVALGAPLTSIPTYSKFAISAALLFRFSFVPSFPAPEIVSALGAAAPAGV